MKWLILTTFLFCAAILHAQPLTTSRTDEGTWILDDGEKVLFYQATTKSLNGEYPRADYIHPLLGLDGFELTEDFPTDHLHHRGIFWAWHRVIIGDKPIGDAWECKDFVWDVIDHKVTNSDATSLTLASKVLWKSSHWKDNDRIEKPFVEEDMRITVFKKKASYRVIDIDISLLALEEKMKIAGSDDEKGYSGFSVRMKMPDDLLFTSSDGIVEPITNQVEAGDWLDISGTLTEKGSKAGIVIIQHPENPDYPEKWIIRKKGSMQNPAYPGREPVALSTERPTILRYRLVVHLGELSTDSIEKLSKFQKTKKRNQD
ncbi:MAG: DUF6807 family protein [Cyclobacteriaceae bacterium]|nr:DUF6807 family protein [Cyclobacteriaceae bacterium]